MGRGNPGRAGEECAQAKVGASGIVHCCSSILDPPFYPFTLDCGPVTSTVILSPQKCQKKARARAPHQSFCIFSTSDIVVTLISKYRRPTPILTLTNFNGFRVLKCWIFCWGLGALLMIPCALQGCVERPEMRRNPS